VMIMPSYPLGLKRLPTPPGWWDGGCTWCKHCVSTVSKDKKGHKGVMPTGRVRCEILGDVDLYFGCYQNPNSRGGTPDGCPYREPR